MLTNIKFVTAFSCALTSPGIQGLQDTKILLFLNNLAYIIHGFPLKIIPLLRFLRKYNFLHIVVERINGHRFFWNYRLLLKRSLNVGSEPECILLGNKTEASLWSKNISILHLYLLFYCQNDNKLRYVTEKIFSILAKLKIINYRNRLSQCKYICYLTNFAKHWNVITSIR